MYRGSVIITYDGDPSDGMIKWLPIMLSDICKFLAAVERFGLATSDMNFVWASLLCFDEENIEHNLKEFKKDSSNLHQALPTNFEHDLLSLHVTAGDFIQEVGPSLKAVWRTTASMQRFSHFLNWHWESSNEYSGPGSHRALDQQQQEG